MTRKKLTVAVTSCISCPWSEPRWNREGPYPEMARVCRKAQRPIEPDALPGIPDWCPLETIDEAAGKALPNAMEIK